MSWVLPRSWRTGPQKWTPEAAQLARLLAEEGIGAYKIAARMQLLGIPVSPLTVDNWLHPRNRTGSAEA